MMVTFATIIFICCLLAGTKTVYDAVRGWADPKSKYLIAKGLVILYLGTVYGILAVDYWYEINVYVSPTSTMGMLFRGAAVVTSFIFLADSWLRNKI